MSVILYQEDIAKNRAMIDYKTSNSSFVRLAIVLKRMGITNHTFFLSLLQPELQGVDPFAKHLDNETKVKILAECKLNPWYFFRECLRVPVAGGEMIHFQLSRGNLAACWAFFNDIDFGLIMPRQTGKSYVTQSIICYMMYVMADNVTIGHFDKDQTNCAGVIRVIKDLRDGMPSWMYEKTTGDTDRKESISYAKKNNTYLTYPSPIDEKSAYKQGRGSTMAILHFDEIAFINYNWVVVPTATNSMLKASEMARRAGLPSPIIYTTTAGNPETPAGAYALNIFENACPFTENMYDLQNRKALLDVVENNSNNHSLYLEFSYRQLGKSDAWFENAARRSNSSQDDINRDLLNIWQPSTDKCILPKDLLAKIRASKRSPNWTDLSNQFAIRWYIPRETVESESFKEKSYILGTDTSENVSRDFTTFVLMDPTDMAVVATCRCNDANTMKVARFVADLLLKYTKFIWIPERKSTAATIIDFVLEALNKANINPYFRIFNEVIQNYHDPNVKNKVDIYRTGELYGKERSAFGYKTGGAGATSRDMLYKVTMMKSLEMNYSRIYDDKLVGELCGLEERNGRIDHAVNGHDDTVFAWMLCSYLCFFGRNMQYYGLDNSQVLSRIGDDGKPTQQNARAEQIAIQQRISQLESLIAANPAYMLKQSYECELASLKQLVDEKIVAINPMAIAQVNYQDEIVNKPSGSTEAKLSSFTNRLTNAYNRRNYSGGSDNSYRW